MSTPPGHGEVHRGGRANWLRAAVLGANDGIVSTASLVLGVAASGASRSAVVTAGVAGLVAGALSMAAGEYVSVSSQRDAEEADLRLEERELAADPEGELHELTGIYERRGLEPALAAEVAAALTRGDALGAHARDELGLEAERRARPLSSPCSPSPSCRAASGSASRSWSPWSSWACSATPAHASAARPAARRRCACSCGARSPWA